jgi:hypothetical protein
MTSCNLALPGLERCDRPRHAPFSASSDHPGLLAQGPDEKFGTVGRVVGFIGHFLAFWGFLSFWGFWGFWTIRTDISRSGLKSVRKKAEVPPGKLPRDRGARKDRNRREDRAAVHAGADLRSPYGPEICWSYVKFYFAGAPTGAQGSPARLCKEKGSGRRWQT